MQDRTKEVLVPQMILNAIGPDRPGIVGEFTGHLHTCGANILDSRMVNLRGQFAMIVLIEADRDTVARLHSSFPRAAEAMGLRLTCVEGDVPARPIPGIPFKLKTYSMDQPGILHRVSEVLREYGVNIEDLVARQESAPFMGTPLFQLEMRLTVPADVSIRELRGKLDSLCDVLNCDVDFEPA
jgi:glycine cleavage system transcriptional repressor